MIGFKKVLMCVVLGALLVSSVAATDATSLAPNTYTPWDMWFVSGLLALGLFIFSLNPPTTPADCEIDAIISVLAWIPAGFCAFASFSIGKVIGPGYVTLYSEPLIGLLMIVFTFGCVANTFRIVAQHGVLKLTTGSGNSDLYE
jgi:hypothetical protein